MLVLYTSVVNLDADNRLTSLLWGQEFGIRWRVGEVEPSGQCVGCHQKYLERRIIYQKRIEVMKVSNPKMITSHCQGMKLAL